MLSEISQTEKDKLSYNLTYMWNLKKFPKQTKKPLKLTDTENRRVVARGRGWDLGEMGRGGRKVQAAVHLTLI